MLRSLERFVRELARSQGRDQLFLRAAALGYTTLLSLVPLLTVALVTVNRVQPERAEEVVRGVATVLPFSSARVRATLTLLAERTAALGGVAVVVSAIVSLNLFYQIEETINAIWGLPERRRWQWRLASFLMVLLWGPLLLTGLFSGLLWIYSLPGFAHFALLIRPLPAVFAIAALTAMYRWVPHTRVPWKAALSGATVATVALALIHVGFQAYLGVAADLNVIYGSLTVILFFLVSLFLFWLAILLGAEASWVVGHTPIAGPVGGADAILLALAEASREGVLTRARARAALGEEFRDVMARLAEKPEAVVPTAHGWRLTASARNLTVRDVRERLGENSADGAWPGSMTVAMLFKELAKGRSREVRPKPEKGSDEA